MYDPLVWFGGISNRCFSMRLAVIDYWSNPNLQLDGICTMKRQLHTRSKNLQSTFIHFVEFQFTEEMLMQVSVSRIPDPRSTQAGRPRTGGRRLQSSWLRRLGGPRRRKRRLRRLHGGAASTLLFNITLVLSPPLLFPGIEVSCRHFPPKLKLPFLCIFYCSYFILFQSH